ncbi:MAG: rRNA maturation RNase YbeY [Bacteroidales bacterium]|jgi:rRNA maturation RNase YbeY|nr:rRNA maturation RNase YbeY [Bacteroidales bacterium]
MAEGSNIFFFLEEISYQLKNKRRLRQWITQAAVNEGYKINNLNFILTNDNILFQLNKEYLQHMTLTDIITFDMSDTKDELAGDIYISVDRARENAKEFHVTLANELCRLMIHGMLHLMAYKDKTDEEKVIMRAREEFYLSLLP